ncbi:hypothetical protein D3C81_1389650 [compost metagenome]
MVAVEQVVLEHIVCASGKVVSAGTQIIDDIIIVVRILGITAPVQGIHNLGIGGFGQIDGIIVNISGIRRSAEIKYGTAVILANVVSDCRIGIGVTGHCTVIHDQESTAGIVMTVVVLDDSALAVVIRVIGHGIAAGSRIINLIELNDIVFT